MSNELNEMSDDEDFRTTMARVIADRTNQTKITLIIEFTRNAQVKKSDYKEKFDLIYSLETVKIRKSKATTLNLQFKVNLVEGIEAGIGLLSTLVSNSLILENFKRLSDKTTDEFIELDLLSQNYHKSITIKKIKRLHI